MGGRSEVPASRPTSEGGFEHTPGLPHRILRSLETSTQAEVGGGLRGFGSLRNRPCPCATGESVTELLPRFSYRRTLGQRPSQIRTAGESGRSNLLHSFKRWVCQLVSALRGLPWLVAMTASAVSVYLSIRPGGITGGVYDAGLALQTATVIAVVWYVYFTFRLSHERGQVVAESRPGFAENEFLLQPWIQNPSDRRLHLRMYVYVEIDGRLIELPDSAYTGSRLIRLESGRSWQREDPLPIHDFYREQRDRAFRHQQIYEALVLMRVEWTNEFCEPGSNTHCQRIDLIRRETTSVDRVDMIEESFGEQM